MILTKIHAKKLEIIEIYTEYHKKENSSKYLYHVIRFYGYKQSKYSSAGRF